MRVDLNADVGESFGAYTIGDDAAVMRSISSANIAAGFHAGDPSVLRRTIRLPRARRRGWCTSRFPGPGRLWPPGTAGHAGGSRGLRAYQIAAVAGVAAAEGVPLRHVKPHGALFNMAAGDAALAAAIARATAAFDPRLILFGLAGSRLLDEGRNAGLRVAAEVFADRAYQADGSLVPRGQAGAVLDDASEIARRAIGMATRGVVLTIDGAEIQVTADTICVHGDAAGAGGRAARLRRDSMPPASASWLPAWLDNLEAARRSPNRRTASSVRVIDSRATRLTIGPATGRSTSGTPRLSDNDTTSTCTPAAVLTVSPVRIEPPEKSMIFAARFGDPGGHAAAGRELRSVADEGHVVFGVVGDRDHHGPHHFEVDAQLVSVARQHPRLDHILLGRRRAGIGQRIDQPHHRDAANQRRTAPFVNDAAWNPHLAPGRIRRCWQNRRPGECRFRRRDIAGPGRYCLGCEFRCLRRSPYHPDRHRRDRQSPGRFEYVAIGNHVVGQAQRADG